jgi:hypothetical protein
MRNPPRMKNNLRVKEIIVQEYYFKYLSTLIKNRKLLTKDIKARSSAEVLKTE